MASVRESNTRAANAARFIGSQAWPADGKPHELVLLCWTGDEDPKIVCRWPFAQVTEELGFAISELVQDYAEEVMQHCKGDLQFRDAQGQVLASRPMRGLYSRANSIGMGAVAYDGSMAAQLQQNQKHLEALMSGYVKLADMVETRAASFLDVVDRIVARIETAAEREASRERERADMASAELEQAKELLDQAVATAEEAAKAADEAAQEDRMGKVIELFTKQLTAGK